jgi:PRC-barrel domain
MHNGHHRCVQQGWNSARVLAMHSRLLSAAFTISIAALAAPLMARAAVADAPAIQGAAAAVVSNGTRPIVLAVKDDDDDKSNEKQPTPEERMAKRYPQPVKVSFLLGLPVLDESSSIIGYVRAVVRTPEGKIQLVMPVGGFFGFGSRLVPIPIEIVAMVGAQVAVVDMPDDRFMQSPTWTSLRAKPLDPSETIRVALTRR